MFYMFALICLGPDGSFSFYLWISDHSRISSYRSVTLLGGSEYHSIILIYFQPGLLVLGEGIVVNFFIYSCKVPLGL